MIERSDKMTDLEIASSIERLKIKDVLLKRGFSLDNFYFYGEDFAKITNDSGFKNGKVILVTAMSPSPYGEGKTTVSIGLHDALCKLNKNSLLVLREPSLGPVFGVKGGATGGGYSQVVPMDKINLHFTGDFHAITSANNLLAASIDNHLFQGNTLNIDPTTICFHRTMDINDRALRDVKTDKRWDKFTITAASEVMMIFCLATDIFDLKKRLGNILIGYTYDKKPVFCKDLKVQGAMTALLKDAMYPNIVQTLEGNPVIIHGGPFANIAHGCNSVIATKLAIRNSDYVITEAGFGADLGAEKFFDIKCRLGIKPSCCCIVATLKAIKYNAHVSKNEILKENIEAVKEGLCNLGRHIDNMKKFGNNIIVVLNKYNDDTDSEIKIVEDYVTSKGVQFSISTAYFNGSDGILDLANKVIDIADIDNNFRFLYDLEEDVCTKIEKIATEIYGSSSVTYSDNAKQVLAKINELGINNYPVCIAKTQYSFTDDSKKLGAPTNFSVFVKDINIYNGAKIITVLLNDIMTMPGLSKTPSYENIDVDENGNIIGIF